MTLSDHIETSDILIQNMTILGQHVHLEKTKYLSIVLISIKLLILALLRILKPTHTKQCNHSKTLLLISIQYFSFNLIVINFNILFKTKS